jgi:hypothetical protein
MATILVTLNPRDQGHPHRLLHQRTPRHTVGSSLALVLDCSARHRPSGCFRDVHHRGTTRSKRQTTPDTNSTPDAASSPARGPNRTPSSRKCVITCGSDGKMTK